MCSLQNRPTGLSVTPYLHTVRHRPTHRAPSTLFVIMPLRRSARIAAYEAQKDRILDKKIRQLQATLHETTSSNEAITEFNQSVVHDTNQLKLMYYRIKFGCERHHLHKN